MFQKLNQFQINRITKKFVDLHANYTSRIMSVADQYMQSRYWSVNNPIWFLADDYDETAFTIDDGVYIIGFFKIVNITNKNHKLS